MFVTRTTVRAKFLNHIMRIIVMRSIVSFIKNNK